MIRVLRASGPLAADYGTIQRIRTAESPEHLAREVWTRSQARVPAGFIPLWFFLAST